MCLSELWRSRTEYLKEKNKIEMFLFSQAVYILNCWFEYPHPVIMFLETLMNLSWRLFQVLSCFNLMSFNVALLFVILFLWFHFFLKYYFILLVCKMSQSNIKGGIFKTNKTNSHSPRILIPIWIYLHIKVVYQLFWGKFLHSCTLGGGTELIEKLQCLPFSTLVN